MSARVACKSGSWGGKSVPFREASSIQEYPHRERGSTVRMKTSLSLSFSLDRAISEPPQPSVARKQGPTGIKTTPNAAYMEVTIAKQRQEPSEPLYEPIGDHSLWRERAKRGVLHLLHLSRSLPRHGATPTATPPQAPPTRAQSLPRLESIT